MDHSETLHRHSLRFKDYDYTQAGAYFVTICTKNHQCIFGEIQQGRMQLNATGRLAAAQWQQLPNRFTDLDLGEWVVMPNHIHGILVITGMGEASLDIESGDAGYLSWDASPLRPVGTMPGSLAAIIQNYKSISSRRISAQDEKLKGLIWQRNYYEHVIRNERELRAISEYIQTNPQNWQKDTEYRG